METNNQMSFHYPEGLAAYKDKSGSYHIREDRSPAYDRRFHKTFGFYDAVATVCLDSKYFHINTQGEKIHNLEFDWAGNFQNGLCLVKTDQRYYHIKSDGTRAYDVSFDYVGDYRYGIAVGYQDGVARHINLDGHPINSSTYQYAELYHKGHAVVKLDDYFTHVDLKGNKIHTVKLKRAEPFYNEIAFCDLLDGTPIFLRENGYYTIINTPREKFKLPTLKSLIEKNAQVGLVFRHSIREQITKETVNWGNDVRLTPEGVALARKFGNTLPVIDTKLYSSPIPRCIETLSCIRPNLDVTTSKYLGNPGAYFDGTGNHEKDAADDFVKFIENYATVGSSLGTKQINEGSMEFIEFLKSKISLNSLSLFCTHDVMLFLLKNHLGLKMPTDKNWQSELGGIAIIQQDEQWTIQPFQYEQ